MISDFQRCFVKWSRCPFYTHLMSSRHFVVQLPCVMWSTVDFSNNWIRDDLSLSFWLFGHAILQHPKLTTSCVKNFSRVPSLSCGWRVPWFCHFTLFVCLVVCTSCVYHFPLREIRFLVCLYDYCTLNHAWECSLVFQRLFLLFWCCWWYMKLILVSLFDVIGRINHIFSGTFCDYINIRLILL